MSFLDPQNPTVGMPLDLGPGFNRWLMREGRFINNTGELLKQVAHTLRWLGLPVDRLGYFQKTLHPLEWVSILMWNSDSDQVAQRSGSYDSARQPIYQDSPVKLVSEEGIEIRRRLMEPGTPNDFPVLDDLRLEGMTDYIALPLTFSDGQHHVLSLATRSEQGLTGVSGFAAQLGALALVLEARRSSQIARTVAESYLGRQTGGRVLEGAITQGHRETINAVLWLADLRGFTHMSETLPTEAVLSNLGSYFEAMADPIAMNGGEILKFMGDGVLAIFPFDCEASQAEMCAKAWQGAVAAQHNFDQMNEMRAADGAEPLEFGLGLHVGPVTYGNIGAGDRLDFTVIGPSVNLVARIEALTAQLKRPVLMSARFAKCAGLKTSHMGNYPLKGIEHPCDIHCPTPGQLKQTLAEMMQASDGDA